MGILRGYNRELKEYIRNKKHEDKVIVKTFIQRSKEYIRLLGLNKHELKDLDELGIVLSITMYRYDTPHVIFLIRTGTRLVNNAWGIYVEAVALGKNGNKSRGEGTSNINVLTPYFHEMLVKELKSGPTTKDYEIHDRQG